MPDAFRRFAEADALLARALELPVGERKDFLAEACGGDVELREASLRLLEATLEPTLESPGAAAMVGRVATRPIGALAEGDRFGAYEVLTPIGAGGMGEVYRARDTRLGREVALKVLPIEFAEDPERLARLQREARILATLNHPCINAIHELEEAEGRKALVLELVEGPTLAERLTEGPLPLPQALRTAKQIAEALEVAHGKGVLHRDLKPSNVKLTSDGGVKVLDFGLAKSVGATAPDQDITGPADLTLMTRTGVILGTAPYMSPEQWRGKTVDRRSDLWAFGCILYEMLTGRRAFGGGETSADTAAAVLERDPDWSALPAETPLRVKELLQRCLEKDPDQRLENAEAARSELEQSLVERSSRRSLPPRRLRRTGLAAALVAVVLLILILGYKGFSTRSRSPIDSIAVLPFENTSDDPEGEYLSDGLTDSLINSLSKLPNLRVVPRGIAFGYKGRSSDPEAVASELGVQALLTGRVGERDGTLVVSAELMDAVELDQLWGQQYTRPADDLLAVQEELVRRIVEELRLELTPEQRQQALDPETENPEAYRLYLKTSYHSVKLTQEGLDKGVEYAQQAVELDPGFALAYVALSKAHMTRAFVGFESWEEAGDKSRAAARRALELDDSLSEAWVELGFVRHHFDWDWEGAEQAFRRAVELDPNNAEALQGHSEALLSLGRVEEALDRARRAVEANPFNPSVTQWLGVCAFRARRYDEALDGILAALQLEPGHLFARSNHSLILLLSGKVREAIEDYSEFLTERGGDPETSLRLAAYHALAGQEEDARTILSRVDFDRLDRFGPFDLASLAQAQWFLGDTDEAFYVLDYMLENRSRGLLWINTDPRWDPLRDDVRFGDLLRRMGLPPSSL